MLTPIRHQSFGYLLHGAKNSLILKYYHTLWQPNYNYNVAIKMLLMFVKVKIGIYQETFRKMFDRVQVLEIVLKEKGRLFFEVK